MKWMKRDKIMNEKKNLIIEYISEEECVYMCKNGLFNCYDCNNLNECYMNAETKYNDELNRCFAESVTYGGYDTAEEFWSELLE